MYLIGFVCSLPSACTSSSAMIEYFAVCPPRSSLFEIILSNSKECSRLVRSSFEGPHDVPSWLRAASEVLVRGVRRYINVGISIFLHRVRIYPGGLGEKCRLSSI